MREAQAAQRFVIEKADEPQTGDAIPAHGNRVHRGLRGCLSPMASSAPDPRSIVVSLAIT